VLCVSRIEEGSEMAEENTYLKSSKTENNYAPRQ
jgi:hypothetical protein